MPPATNVNSYILNKYCWMSRQLRNFNDSNSIIQWSNAMLSVKNLLLKPIEADILLSTTLSTKSANNLSNTHHALTISHPSSLRFLPAPEPCHSLSRTWNATFLPQRPSPLSIFTPRELSIPPHTPPDESHNPPSKRRKTILPPEVDCKAPNFLQPRTTNNNKPTTAPDAPTISKAPTYSQFPATRITPGTHIWHGFMPYNKKHAFWAYKKFNGSEEYKILQEMLDSKDSFTAKKLTTGQKFIILLPSISRLRN